MDIEALKKEAFRLTVERKVNPHSNEWQQLREQIYRYNEERREREQQKFEQFKLIMSEQSEFCIDKLPIDSDDTSGSDSSVYRNSSSKKVKGHREISKSGKVSTKLSSASSSKIQAPAPCRSESAKNQKIQRFGGV